MLKIAIVGAECSGKSTLSEHLAHYFETVWLPEYARTYLPTLPQTHYTPEDILHIAQTQDKQAKELIETYQDKKVIFVDTELLVCHIWALFVFGKSHAWIQEHLLQQPYDLYLLTLPDLPWQADPLREQPDLCQRQAIHTLYVKHLEQLGFPYFIISGQTADRFGQAQKIVENKLQKNI